MMLIRWLAVLLLAALAGKLISKLKLPSILGWLIVGMIFGPHALGLMPQEVMDALWYKVTIMWMQCAFGRFAGLYRHRLLHARLRTRACQHHTGNDRSGCRHQ